MKVDFKRLTWENYPSTETPINADNLNRLEEGVAGLYSDMRDIEQELEGGVGEHVTNWLTEHVNPVGSAVVVDNTLSIEGAAADAKKTGDEISSLKEDFDSLENLLTEEETLTIDKTSTWSVGLRHPNGNVTPSYTSYRYNDPITVKAGDVVKLRKSDNSSGIAKVTRICAYVDGVAVASKGEADDFTMPWTVPEGVTGVSMTINAAYFADGNPFYRIDTTQTKAKPNTIMEVVTQTEQITTVQKEVVETQIEVVSSARNAANNGVLPSNDGTTNFTNLQSLLDVGGTIVVDVPGVYEINGMLKIGSDTELIFGKQVYMKQMNNTGGFIVNVGASTNTYNENIAIRGLNLICNGKTGDTASYRFGLRGKLGFGWVKNLVLSDIYVDDIPNATYFIHLAEYENVLIEHCHIEGNKDGIHSAGGNGLIIRDCYFNTTDDPIALNCQDYFPSVPYYSWIKNVLIENCVDASPSGSGGAPRARSILFYGGAWLDWESGNTYRNGDTVVASNNCVYRLYSTTAISDATAITSTVEPTHNSGSVTESDGCTWRFIQDTPIYNVACENVTVRNFVVKSRRTEVFRFHNDNSQYVRSIYPGAIMPCHRNIIFDGINVIDTAHADYYIGIHEPIDNIKVINSLIRAIYIFRLQGQYDMSAANNTMNVAILANDFKKETGGIVLVLLNETGKTVNVKAYGNYHNQNVSNSVSNGTCNMLANDLF